MKTVPFLFDVLILTRKGEAVKMFEDVSAYIDENILHSKVWDEADVKTRTKAVNNAQRMLKNMLPKIYGESIPVEHLSEQSIWMLKIDDSFQRSELGATSMAVDGFSISIQNKDRSIAPFILSINGISPDAVTGGLSKRRVGRYSKVSDAKRYIY